MKTTNNKAKLLALAIVPVLGAAAIAGSAFAADGTSSPSTTTQSSWVGKMMGAFHRGKKRDNTQLANNLASILGLSATDVKAKLDAGQSPETIITAAGKTVADVQAQLKALRIANLKTKLDAKVAAGTMTQAQENTILTNLENGTGRRLGLGHMKGHRDDTQFATNLASVLGLSTTDVKAKLDAGQTPDSIITGAGKTVADVQAQIKALRLADMKTKLAADVTTGKLTQVQADAILARESNETGSGFHMGRHMGHKFFGTSQTTNTTGTSTQ